MPAPHLHHSRGDGDAEPAVATAPPAVVTAPPAVVTALGLGLRTRRGWTFRALDLHVGPTDLVVAAGRAGRGRTSLLLTLAGRMRATEGHLEVAGLALPGAAREVRRRVAVARIGAAIELEGQLTVGESLGERALLDRVDDAAAATRFTLACELLGLDVARDALVDDLDLLDRARLAVALAQVAAGVLVVVDDVDRGLHREEERVLWQGLRAVADAGTAVVASSTDDVRARDLADAVVELGAGEAVAA